MIPPRHTDAEFHSDAHCAPSNTINLTKASEEFDDDCRLWSLYLLLFLAVVIVIIYFFFNSKTHKNVRDCGAV